MTIHTNPMDEATERTPPWWRPGRLLRMPTGVREEILAVVPSERPRYTAMGGIVLGTAMMATLSMAVALLAVLGAFHPVIVPVVLVWGAFILGVDCYLMATVTTVRKAIPRILSAVIFGVIIAEGLLLGLFHTAIEERVAAGRAEELGTRGSELLRCNPVPGTPEASLAAADQGCAVLRLDVPVVNQPDAIQTELDGLKAKAVTLKETVDKDAQTHEAMVLEVRKECNGATGEGLTGKRGDGPACKDLRSQADDFYRDRSIQGNNELLGRINQQIKDRIETLANAQAAYTEKRGEVIETEVQKVRDRHQEIGLLERFRTLDELVSENGYVHTAQWGLRVFFIFVDALPVLLKVLGGTTAYDRLAAARVRVQEDNDRRANLTSSQRNSQAQDTERRRITADAAAQRRKIDDTALLAHSHASGERERRIDARVAQLLGEESVWAATQPAAEHNGGIKLGRGGSNGRQP